MGSFSGLGTKIPHAARGGQKRKKNTRSKPEVWDSEEASGLVNKWRCQERCTWRGHGDSVPLPILTLLTFIWLFPELHPFI